MRAVFILGEPLVPGSPDANVSQTLMLIARPELPAWWLMDISSRDNNWYKSVAANNLMFDFRTALVLVPQHRQCTGPNAVSLIAQHG